MRQIIGGSIILFMLLWVLLNGVFMIVSPSRWTRLPNYIALPGPRHLLNDTRAGRFLIRVTGLMMLIVIGTVLLDASRKARYSIPRPPDDLLWGGICLGMGAWGLALLGLPGRILKYLVRSLPELDHIGRYNLSAILMVFFRASGVLLISVAIYLAWVRYG